MGRHLRGTVGGVALAVVLAAIAAAGPGFAASAGKELPLFGGGKPRVYLEPPDAAKMTPGLSRAIEDFRRCFREMTGVALPCRRAPLQLSPDAPGGLRVECTVARLTDASANGRDNAALSLVLSPATFFEGGPFAGPGEKVAWECTWHRALKQIDFRLVVAKQPYYGPGYGPFTFAEAEIKGFEADGPVDVRLALEMRAGEGVRGSYRIGGAPWVTTEWFDPARAGTDAREPGKSDKNGPQAWSADWARRWSGATAFFVTGYAAKGRAARLTIGSVEARQGEKPLFQWAAGSDLTTWTQSPLQGKVGAAAEGIAFEPASDAWNTVGVRADRLANVAGLAPVRLEVRDAPKGKGIPPSSVVQGYEIHVGGKGITVRAGTRLGLQNALYGLLDRWGCRWVLPGALGEVIPRRSTLVLPVGILKSPPTLDTAVEAGGRTGDLGDYYHRNSAGWERWLSGQHYWPYAIPPDTYFKQHPTWFALIGGKRVPAQICTSNPEVVAKMIEVAREFLRTRPWALSFPMDPQDNIDFCQCDACRAQDPPGVGRDGNPLMTDRVIRFANTVADAIRDEYPDRLVALYAYWTHTEPPVGVRPASNVAVIVTRSNHCLLHLQPNPRCRASLDFHRLLSRWAKLTRHLYVYEYDPISWTGFLPCPTYLERAGEMRRLFRDYGVKGVVTDRAPGEEQSSANYINNYFERRMKSDPSRDPDAVLVGLCRGFFGPAAGPMERYYRALARAVECPHTGRYAVGIGTHRYHELFTHERVSTARKAIDAARVAAAGRTPYAERVRFVEMSQRYLEAYLDGVWSAGAGASAGHRNSAGAAGAGSYDRAVAAFDRVDRLIDEMAAAGAINAGDARVRMRTVRLKTLAERFPDRLGMVRTWKLLGPFNNDARDADVRTDPFQPVIYLDRPVAGAGNWTPYESPTGFLNLEEALKGPPRSWKLSYAYAGVKVSVPKAVAVQLRMDSFFPFRVFLNGQEVYHRPGLDSDCPDKRIVSVDLPAGESTLVLKLTQTALTSDAFPWGLYFRMTDGLGNPVPFPKTANATLALDTRALGRSVAAFPSRWAFRKDPQDEGERLGWHHADFDESAWEQIPVPSPWENTAGAYDGFAWYRVRFSIPAEAQGKKLLLGFEGVDEQAWVYLNGELIGERTVRSTGKTAGEIWDQPFTIPVRSARFGAENVLAVRVHDSAFAGGIFGGVRVVGME